MRVKLEAHGSQQRSSGGSSTTSVQKVKPMVMFRSWHDAHIYIRGAGVWYHVSIRTVQYSRCFMYEYSGL